MFASLHTSSLALGRVERQGKRGLFARVRDAMTLSAQRRQLAALDDALLADIGLSRQQALTEAARSAWDVPRHWLR
ncbi:protein of unknown function [Gemmobacter megaterium]|uniref:YjiS-like domain-containing protein n=1 Tax=Gemmobacter megaterium TaxID=1086013 RepID=A0A1N7JZT5_9RHOB|nr:DUF1127 domain-containing protein [Gemmobacter megaterium]GGD99733.1 hypothetical protein GCM10011345_01360 [Gemmobacter megaterium]SIS54849.1 protein of unknown function [Gemmobacter megaterium]